MQCFLVMHRLAEYKGAIYIFRSDPADHFLIGRFLCIASGQIRRRRIFTYTHTHIYTHTHTTRNFSSSTCRLSSRALPLCYKPATSLRNRTCSLDYRFHVGVRLRTPRICISPSPRSALICRGLEVKYSSASFGLHAMPYGLIV